MRAAVLALALTACQTTVALPSSSEHLDPPERLIRPLTSTITFETPDQVHKLCKLADGPSNKHFYACTLCTVGGQAAVITPILRTPDDARSLRHELAHVADCFDHAGPPPDGAHQGWKENP